MAKTLKPAAIRSTDPRQPPHLIETEADLRDMLGDEHHHKLISKGGSWWLHTEIARAKAKGDQKTATKLQAEADKRVAEIIGRIGAHGTPAR